MQIFGQVHTDHVVLANACCQHVPGLGEGIGRNTPILSKLKDLLISSTEWKKIIIAISNKVFPLYIEYVTLLPTLPSALPFTPAASTSTNPVSGKSKPKFSYHLWIILNQFLIQKMMDSSFYTLPLLLHHPHLNLLPLRPQLKYHTLLQPHVCPGTGLGF